MTTSPVRTRTRTTSTVAMAAAVGAFLASLLLVLDGPVAAWERITFALVNGLPDLIHVPVWVVMQAGSLMAVPVVAAVALWRRRQGLAVQLAVAGGSAYLLALVVKELVARGRPAGLLDDVVVRGAVQSGLGYVSGHTTIAVALATVATPHLGRRGRVAAWAAAVVVGLGRIYVGAHLPLDVVGGAALGVLIGLLTLTLARAAARTSPRTSG